MDDRASETQKRQAAEKSGRRAERKAEIFLRLKGYRLLERRYKTRAGEIDLIMRKSDCVVFVEVKHRSNPGAFPESLTYQSERRIMAAADIYMNRHHAFQSVGMEIRFDVIYVGVGLKFRHLKNGFDGFEL